MEPVLFGEPALYGVYHPALAEAPRPLGVLLCPPIGHEHTRSYRALKVLAETLARAGHHVLRFDYWGTGDSSGVFEDASVPVWCEDVGRAARELVALSGMREIRLVGLRLGAALAACWLAAGARLGRIRTTGLVAWDPVLSGAGFLGTADSLHAAFVHDPVRFPRLERIAGGASPADGDDRLGYSFASPLRASLLGLDLREPQAWPAVPLSFVTTEPSAEVERLSAALLQGGRQVACIAVPEADAGWSDYARHEKTLRAGRVARAIHELLEDVRA